MPGYMWSWRNPVGAFASARDAQLGMKWEEAQMQKQAALGAAAYGAESKVLGARIGERGTLEQQAMVGEQGMEQQTLRGKQGMEQLALKGKQEMDVAGLHAETTRGLAAAAEAEREKNYLRGTTGARETLTDIKLPIYKKLLANQGLTKAEETVIGEDKDYTSKALRIISSDPAFFALSDEEKLQRVETTSGLLKRAGQTNQRQFSSEGIDTERRDAQAAIDAGIDPEKVKAEYQKRTKKVW